jgi:molybdate transport system permease protein
VRSARLGFIGVDRQLEESAITEGANPWQLFRYVMVPGAGVSLISGALLCLARALGEFGATLLFAGNLMGRTQTMPLAIYVGLESDRGVAIALSLILLFVSALLLALLRTLERNWKSS